MTREIGGMEMGKRELNIHELRRLWEQHQQDQPAWEADFLSYHRSEGIDRLTYVFRAWVDLLVSGNLMAIEMKQGTHENYFKVLIHSTACTFLAFEDDLKAEGIRSPVTLYFDHLIPPLSEFFEWWKQKVGQTTDRGTRLEPAKLGPANALKMLEDMLLQQIGHVPSNQLQEQRDALMETSGDLLGGSTEFYEHVKNHVWKHVRKGHVRRNEDIANLIDDVFWRSVEDAKFSAGPARLKKGGINAGEPKTLDDIFGAVFLTERLRKRLKGEQGAEPPTPEQIKQLLSEARSRCTPLQFEYLKLTYKDGLSVRKIAGLKGKSLSVVQEGISGALKKIPQKYHLKKP